MPDDPDALATVIAGLQDVYLPVDALHNRCLTVLNGGDEELPVLLTSAKEVLLTAWWQARDSIVFLREAGLIRSGEALYPKVSPDILESDDNYDDNPRKAVASLEVAIGEVEQQVYGLVHSGDIEAVDVKRIKEALLLIGHLTSIALERVEKIDGLRSGLAPSPKAGPDFTDYIRELGQMYLNDPDRMTETESAFIDAATKPRTREIEYHLHELGGKGAMLRVHDAILEEHGPRAAGMLRIAWGGIGLWLN